MVQLILAFLAAAMFALTGAPSSFFAVVNTAGAGLFDFPKFGPGLGYVTIQGTITESEETVRRLKELDGNVLVKGFLIRVESPGGGVTASHEMYREIKRISESGKPVVVSMGSIAASGGYYVSVPADVIVANPGTLTGSIGVIMQFPVVTGLMDKVGLGVETVKSKAHKDIGSPFRSMTDADRELLQDVVTDVYHQFVDIVREERGLDDDDMRTLADGRILTGRQAWEAGLVDTLGTLEDARRIAGELAGLGDRPRLIKPKRRMRSWVLDFFEETAGRVFGIPTSPRLSYIWY